MKFKKLLKYFAFLLLTCLAIYAYLLLWPQVMFSNKTTWRNFSIYSNDSIDGNIQNIVDSAIRYLKASEIYDSTVHQKFFFINKTFYYTMTRTYSKGRLGYHEYLINNSVIVPEADVKKNLMILAEGGSRKLCPTIVHETVHSMQHHRLGFFRVLASPKWKIEGYAFLIAKPRDVLYKGHLKSYILPRFTAIKSSEELSKNYWAFAVMVAYQLKEKHLTFDQLMNDSVNESNTKAEVIEWLSKQGEIRSG